MVRKLKLLWFYLLSSFSKPNRERYEKFQAEQEHRINKVTLSDAREEKLEAIKEWSKPENIAARIKQLEEDAPKALAAAKAFREFMGLPPEDPPLPPQEMLTDEMKRQQPSMIRIMLRDAGWEYDWDKKYWLKPIDNLTMDKKIEIRFGM